MRDLAPLPQTIRASRRAAICGTRLHGPGVRRRATRTTSGPNCHAYGSVLYKMEAGDSRFGPNGTLAVRISVEKTAAAIREIIQKRRSGCAPSFQNARQATRHERSTVGAK